MKSLGEGLRATTIGECESRQTQQSGRAVESGKITYSLVAPVAGAIGRDPEGRWPRGAGCGHKDGGVEVDGEGRGECIVTASKNPMIQYFSQRKYQKIN
jgi:hypothetical protein